MIYFVFIFWGDTVSYWNNQWVFYWEKRSNDQLFFIHDALELDGFLCLIIVVWWNFVHPRSYSQKKGYSWFEGSDLVLHASDLPISGYFKGTIHMLSFLTLFLFNIWSRIINITTCKLLDKYFVKEYLV